MRESKGIGRTALAASMIAMRVPSAVMPMRARDLA
jgi:hypothetical protein